MALGVCRSLESFEQGISVVDRTTPILFAHKASRRDHLLLIIFLFALNFPLTYRQHHSNHCFYGFGLAKVWIWQTSLLTADSATPSPTHDPNSCAHTSLRAAADSGASAHAYANSDSRAETNSRANGITDVDSHTYANIHCHSDANPRSCGSGHHRNHAQ